MPEQKTEKPEPARRPNLRDHYRKLAMPAVVAALVAGGRSSTGRDRSRGDAERSRPERS